MLAIGNLERLTKSPQMLVRPSYISLRRTSDKLKTGKVNSQTHLTKPSSVQPRICRLRAYKANSSKAVSLSSETCTDFAAEKSVHLYKQHALHEFYANMFFTAAVKIQRFIRKVVLPKRQTRTQTLVAYYLRIRTVAATKI
jgi:hypothetical protein